MEIQSSRIKTQLQIQTEDAFYGNSQLNSTNAIDINFVNQLDKEITELKDLVYKLAEYSNPRVTKAIEYWETMEKIQKILKQ